MSGYKDWRDLEEEVELFAYVSPSTQPKTIRYIEKSQIEEMKKLNAPTTESSSDGSSFHCSYYENTAGKYAGSATFLYYLTVPEIVVELMKDEDFVARNTARNSTWFFPKEIQEIFVF